uniref:Vacuolar protein sorting-associated protein 54 n=1 Tax=Angiostrongylus cantonensis TaxID=6313 RepID=A0A158PA13_ANGCA
LSAVLSYPGRSRSEVNSFFTRHWGDAFVPLTSIPRSTLIPPISDQQFVTYAKNSDKVSMLMNPSFRLSDQKSFTDMFIIPPKGMPDPLTVTKSGLLVKSHLLQTSGMFRDYQMLSAQLESFHDVVDSRLATRLVTKSKSFWQMVHSYGGLHEELADSMSDIRKIRVNLQSVATLICERTRKIIRLFEQREKKNMLLAKLLDVACLRDAQSTVQMLLNQSDYPKAIECIETSEEVLSSELSGVQCFRHLGSQLTELYGVIGRMMLEDFASLIQKEFGMKPEDGVLMIYDGELSCVIMGLVQVRRYAFMSIIRTEIMEAMKGILRHEVKLHIVESGLDLTDFDPTLNQLGEPVRRLKFQDWLKTVTDVTREFFHFCRRIQALQELIQECAKRIHTKSNAIRRTSSAASQDWIQTHTVIDLSSSDHDVSSSVFLLLIITFTFASPTSSDASTLLAVEIRSLPQLLKSASVLTEFAHHCAQTRLCRLLIARSKVCEQDPTTPDQLAQLISLAKTYQKECADEGWHKTEPVAVSPLSMCLQKLCLEYIERFHTQRRSKMRFIYTFLIVSFILFMFRSALIFIKILADYCECFAALPTFAADILSRVVELLKGFNSRCCQLILGAGALQLVGLKTISVRNLALASRSLQLIVHFVPLVAKEAELSLRDDQKHLMRHIKQVDHFETRQLYVYLFMLVAIPSTSFQQICRQMVKFHNGLAGIIPDDQIKNTKNYLINNVFWLAKNYQQSGKNHL